MNDMAVVPGEIRQATLKGVTDRCGPDVTERARQGVDQVAAAWRESDGSTDDFQRFVRERFVADPAQRSVLLDRIEDAQLQINGHLGQMSRSLRRWRDVETHEDPGIDEILASFSPTLDLAEELYRQDLAFVVLLNFPRQSLERKLAEGANWSVDQWAEARVADAVPRRLPRELSDMQRLRHRRAQEFIYGFHVPVGAIVDRQGGHPFPRDRKLLAHWVLRDELRNLYGDEDGLPKQQFLINVMGRHIDGTIPRAVMDGSAEEWRLTENSVNGQPVGDDELVGVERYAVWHDLFGLAKATDPHYPDYPTHIKRSLELQRELSVEQVETLLRDVLAAPVRAQAMEFVSSRLGRKLEPFDIYYRDPAPAEPSAELNAAVRRRFPQFESFEAQVPVVLQELGFDRDTADFIAAHIKVEPARGCGHASPPPLEEYPSLLRTHRIDGSLDWPALRVTMHELGHCVEQVFGFHRTPRKAMRGVPNTAFSEAMAFAFEKQARRVAGISQPERQQELSAVSDLLMACEIAGPSLVDLLAWRWLYANPEAGPEALRDAALRIADEVWQQYFEPYFGPDNNRLLAAYQHMVAMMLYLPNYTIGHLIAHQVGRHLSDETFAGEVERICSLGKLTPALWMERAVGSNVSVETLVEDSSRALSQLAG